MIPLSTAMRDTRAAETLATTPVRTALVVSSIAVSAAATLGVSARPLLMTVTVATAAAFLIPVATPVNVMIKEPGGYHVGDYWKLVTPAPVLVLRPHR